MNRLPAACGVLLTLALQGSLAQPQALDGEAANALVFEEQLDARCQNLSPGGKLVVLRNRDPERTIRYRLIRMFVDVPQGLIDGAIAPGDVPQPLGCNRVNDRHQYWRVERASFEDADDTSAR